MIEKDLFKRHLNIDISVATIGINRDDWYCHKPGMTKAEVKKAMLHYGFDVVPIINKAGVFSKYFSLKEGKAELEINSIESEDTLYYLTHVRDAVWKMKFNKRTHYFLTNGRDDNEICGLLSLSNFNCREFSVYVFSILAYIELELANLIESERERAFEILRNYSHSKDLLKQMEIIETRYNDDKQRNNENDYKEYLYLHHLITLVKYEKTYRKLEYRKSDDFERGTSGLKQLRNQIAHPVKSLVRNLQDLDNLDMALNKLYELKERIDKYLKL